jgi:hypothetical protein
MMFFLLKNKKLRAFAAETWASAVERPFIVCSLWGRQLLACHLDGE